MLEKEKIVHFLKELRLEIISHLEALEQRGRFVHSAWEHKTGGGGEIGLLRGDVFEKGAVNWSAVEGPHFPMKDGQGPFFATGISVITPMQNPHVPTAHFNVRYLETAEKSWLGGGFDLT